MSLRIKLILYLIVPLFGVFFLFLMLGMRVFEKNVQQEIGERLAETAELHAVRIEVLLREVAQVARTTADYLSVHHDLDEKTLYGILRKNVAGNPLVYGAAIAFERDSYPGKHLFSPYAYTKDNGDSGLESFDLATGYDYTLPEWDWWNLPKETLEGVWTEPYFDEGGGNILMTTFSIPFYKDGKFNGVATVDVPLQPLKELLSLPGEEHQYFVLLSKQRRFLYSENLENIGRTFTEVLQEKGKSELQLQIEETLASSANKTIRVSGWKSPEPQWISPVTISSGNWMLLSILDDGTAMAFLNRQRQRGLAILGAAFLVSALLGWLLLTWITHPLRKLASAVDEVGRGNLEVRIKRQSSDEIGDLADRFAQMLQKLARRETALRKGVSHCILQEMAEWLY